VKSHVSSILAPKDKVYFRRAKNCLEIKLNPKRQELTRTWIGKKYQVIGPDIGSASLAMGRECRLKVERTLRASSNTTKLKIGQRSGVNRIDSNSMGKRSTSLLLSSGRQGRIRYNDEIVFLKCIKGGGDNYQVEISVDAPQGGLSSSVSLVKGQKINIGEIINQNRARSSRLSLSSGAAVSSKEALGKFNYFLMID